MSNSGKFNINNPRGLYAKKEADPKMASIVGIVLAISIFGMLSSNSDFLRNAGSGLLLVASVILIFRQPYWGVILTMISLPLTEIIYQSQFMQYYLIAVGGITVIRYLMQTFHLKRFQGSRLSTTNRYAVYIWAFFFVFWTFGTNPQAALFLGDRIWLLTLVQLFILTWLAGELFDTVNKQKLLMGAYVLATSVSAIVALQETYISDSFGTSIRATGLAGGANTTVRLFIYALLMLAFLLRSSQKGSRKFFGILGVVLLATGVVATVSRSGFLMLGIAFALIFWDDLTKRLHVSTVLVFIAMFFVAVFWIPDSYWQFMLRDAPNEIAAGTDTIGFRYQLWQAAWRIWQNYPVAGVGIGQYQSIAPYYGAPIRYIEIGAHSIYFALLAENGIVGLALYFGMVLIAVKYFVMAIKNGNGEWKGLAQTWLFILLLVLVGGITKHDQYDKFPWLIVGMSVAILNNSNHKDLLDCKDEFR